VAAAVVWTKGGLVGWWVEKTLRVFETAGRFDRGNTGRKPRLERLTGSCDSGFGKIGALIETPSSKLINTWPSAASHMIWELGGPVGNAGLLNRSFGRDGCIL
jgi:hypothetical protein